MIALNIRLHNIRGECDDWRPHSRGGRVARGGRAGGRAARLADRRHRQASVRSQGARRVGLAASGRVVAARRVRALLVGGGAAGWRWASQL